VSDVKGQKLKGKSEEHAFPTLLPFALQSASTSNRHPRAPTTRTLPSPHSTLSFPFARARHNSPPTNTAPSGFKTSTTDARRPTGHNHAADAFCRRERTTTENRNVPTTAADTTPDNISKIDMAGKVDSSQ
jgi:hypothetical protein